MGNETGVVVNEGKEEGLPFLVGVGRIGQVGAVQGVALPKVAKSAALKAAIGFGRARDCQQRGGCASFCQLTAQSTLRQTFFGNRVFRIQFQDADDGAGGAKGLFAFEGLRPFQRFYGNGARGGGASGARLEGIEASLPVQLLPAVQASFADAALAIGEGLRFGGDVLAQLSFQARGRFTYYRQDQGVARQSDFGAFFCGHFFLLMDKMASVYPIAGGDVMQNYVGGGANFGGKTRVALFGESVSL